MEDDTMVKQVSNVMHGEWAPLSGEPGELNAVKGFPCW